MLIDLHVHSTNTKDASFSVEELASRAKQAGLDGLCLTDVHTVGSIQEIRKVSSSAGIVILVGVEACTEHGHFLALVPDPGTWEDLEWPLDEDGQLSYQWLVDTISRQGGILVAAHPFDRKVPGSPGDSLVQLPGVSAVEVLNASRPQLVNELAEEIAAGAGLPGVGGSDGRNNLDLIGKFATLVSGPLENEAELIERIQSYDVWPVAIGKAAFPSGKGSLRGRERRNDQRRGRGDSSRADRPGGGRGDRRRSGPRGGRGSSRNQKGGGRSQRRGRGGSKPPKPQ